MDLPSNVHIHSGFYILLFGRHRTKGKTKYDVIFEEVAKLLQTHRGYRLYVTGHSLGGAIATLFAFYAAASFDQRIPKPVTCIAFASPKLAGIDFRISFRALEKAGCLRCVRVSNDRDVVTTVPTDRSGSCMSQSRIYRHVGMSLTLYNTMFYTRSMQLGYTRRYPGFCGLCCHDWSKQTRRLIWCLACWPTLCCKEDYTQWHSCAEYTRRIEAQKEELQTQHLNYLYSRIFTKEDGDDDDDEAVMAMDRLLYGNAIYGDGKLPIELYQ
mmetsp:Transcript_7308/g.11238  ORF Transcript_7308/g.11238 Transcript_7308/m.11238 type:complete len:269 (+) Transcript_7308:431-1237(+)